jgi:hypothetical protein
MGLFRKKTPPVSKGPLISNPLAVVPLKPMNVEVKKDSQGMIHLKMTPPLKPFKRKVAKWLNYDYCSKLELDEYGTFFYSLVDGQHTLSSIIDAMAEKLGQGRKETAQNVVAFTKSLMTRNMLVLMVPEKSSVRGES